MRMKLVVAGMLASFGCVEAAVAQAVMPVPYGGTRPAPVPQSPTVNPKDTPEEIAKDSARDLSDDHFYNRPGATRASYDAAWQRCRLIARGSRTPSGSIPYSYNPALVSPLAAGIGGGLGGLLAGAIAEGQQRRANRRSCLLIEGWRMIEVPPATATRLKTMTEDQRSTYFNGIVGAAQVDGKVTERTSFTQPVDPVFNLDAPVFGPGSVYLGKKVDPKAPFVLAPGEAAVVLAFRRPDALSAGRSALVQLARYDVAGRDLLYRRKDWKKTGDKTVYEVAAGSADRKAPYEVQVLKVTPGDYVIASTAVVAKIATTSYCFGAPTFHVDPGAVLYVGDFVPVVDAKLKTGETVSTLAYASHIEDARRTLTTSQPALGAALRPATMQNRATYACSAITMDRWDLPGVGSLPPAAAQ
ncbi:hypothetical protein [Sphingomonas faeni]|uniref:hypothetical protein n=1 Tax=Sphingomonas faeni TaxID=185950 RepID=UPI0033632492